MLELKRHSDYDLLPLFEGRILRDVWPRLEATLSTDPVADFAYLTPGSLGCTEPVVRQLDETVRFELEALPLLVEEQKYLIVNVINVIDCLDRSRSTLRYYPGSDRVREVSMHAFQFERIGDSALFKIPESVRTEIFCTDRVRNAILAKELAGLEFQLVADSDVTNDSVM